MKFLSCVVKEAENDTYHFETWKSFSSVNSSETIWNTFVEFWVCLKWNDYIRYDKFQLILLLVFCI